MTRFCRRYLATDVPLPLYLRSPREAAHAILKSEQRKLREMPACPEHGCGVVEIAHTTLNDGPHQTPERVVSIYLYCPLCER